MKYDDVSWHVNGNYPPELPHQAAATHTGMFVSWALLTGLAGPLRQDIPDGIAALQQRTTTPGQFFWEYCDGKFVDLALNKEGNAFAKAYFDFAKGSYLADYEAVLGGELPSLYHIADTWENFDRIKPLLDKRLLAWRSRS